MAKVYLVYEKYYNNSEWTTVVETDIVKVFDTEAKAVNYIRETVKGDHERFDSQGAKNVRKYDWDENRVREGHEICSFEDYQYHEAVAYMYKSYDVE